MSTIAIDPGKTTGIALYLSPAHPPIVASWVDPTSREILACLRHLDTLGFTTLAIEDQHVPKKGKVNWPALQRLMRGAARWMTCAEFVGMKVEWVHPEVWQSRMLPDAKGKTTKQRCALAVAHTYDHVRRWDPKKGEQPADAKLVEVARLNEHIRDAMMMGRWRVLHGGGR